MPMITIHRGTNQIGGTITEIATETTKILIDFGMSLSKETEHLTDKDMSRLVQKTSYDAVFISHYHGDHVGLIGDIPEDVPVYMGKQARRILINIRKKLLSLPKVANREQLQRELEVLKKNNGDKENLFDKQSYAIGNIKVTSYLVDHSAYDAYMFLIEADGKTILHTADFRTHGRIGRGFFSRLKQDLGSRTIDVLIVEGTMLNRREEAVITEEMMMQKATDLLAKPENKYAFVLCSSMNMESLASFYSAACKNNRAFYVPDYVLKEFRWVREAALQYSFDFNFYKSYDDKLDTWIEPLTMKKKDYMVQEGFLMLVGKHSYSRMKEFEEYNPLLIYSLWQGYLDKDKEYFDADYADMCHRWRTEYLHTSGHATANDISKLIKTVRPTEAIIPIHTENPEAFQKLDIGSYTEKIKILQDGETYQIKSFV